jgi:hypothetical protein
MECLIGTICRRWARDLDFFGVLEPQDLIGQIRLRNLFVNKSNQIKYLFEAFKSANPVSNQIKYTENYI